MEKQQKSKLNFWSTYLSHKSKQSISGQNPLFYRHNIGHSLQTKLIVGISFHDNTKHGLFFYDHDGWVL